MKPFLIIWINFMVILAAVFTYMYLQQSLSTTTQKTPVRTSTITISPQPKQSARRTYVAPQQTAPQSTSFHTNHTPSGILINPFDTTQVPSYTKTQTVIPKKSVAVSTKPAPNSAQVQQAELISSASKIRKALVNILCVSSIGNTLHYISGSGIVISSQGVILTNAHVAQYFLLKNYPHAGDTTCTVRTGSPAQNAYYASLMFISPAWIAKNSTTAIQKAPTGTGEHDIALLAITSSATTQPLTSTFPFLPLARSVPKTQMPVVIGSYAAQFLSLNEIQSSLYPTIVYGHVKKIYTFATSTTDLVSLGGTAAAQEGSSGGGIVNTNGDLTGTITTSTVTGSTQKRDLHALTAVYIRRDYEQEMHQSLDALLANTPSYGVASFAQKRKTLRAIVVNAISSQ